MAGGWGPRWGKDGREVFYRDIAQNQLMRVPVDFNPEPLPGSPEALFSIDDYSVDAIITYDYDPGRDRFLFIKKPSEDDLPRDRIVIVQNWLTEVSDELDQGRR